MSGVVVVSASETLLEELALLKKNVKMVKEELSREYYTARAPPIAATAPLPEKQLRIS